MRAVTGSQVPLPGATDYRENRNNRAAIARLFEKGMLSQLHKLGSHASLDIVH